MIAILKRLQRDFIITLSGAQEALISIADHVNQHVQKVRLNLETSALEKKIQDHQVILGEKLFRRPELSLSQFYENTDVYALADKVLRTKKRLEASQGIVSPYEALHDFERLLIRSDFVMQNIVILDGFSGLGKTVQALSLPSKMLIFFIKKRNQVELAFGNMRISVADEVTFLCPKENIQDYIAFWKS